MKNEGVLILFLSIYRGGEERKYDVEDSDQVVQGTETNDAPVRYLLQYALSEGEQNAVGKILCIASRQVRKKDEDGKSDVDRFREMVKTYIQDDKRLSEHYEGIEGRMPEIVIIDYDEDEDLGTSERSMRVYRQIAKCLEHSEGEKAFYIDYTGGLRDVGFLMTAIVRYLEYQGWICRKIVYSNGNRRMIQSIDCIYEMFRLINGVEQFVRTGNAGLLRECYEKEGDFATEELLGLMVRFSEAVSLCDLDGIDHLLPEISDALNHYRDREKEPSFFVEMFDGLIDIIRKKLYLSEGNTLTYPQLIRWCVDNDLILQALGIYVEKLPKYYYESGLLQMPEDVASYITIAGSEAPAAFYGWLFDYYVWDDKMEELKAALDKLIYPETGRVNLKSAIDACSSNETRKAVKRIQDFLKKYYDNEGNKKGSQPGFYGRESKNCRTDRTFLNDLKMNPAARHYFLYDDPKGYEERYGTTLEKKLFALNTLRKTQAVPSGTKVKPEVLYEMMKYYLAVKIVRNNIFHAGGKDRAEENSKILEQLRKTHGLDVQTTYKGIKELLRQGVRAHIG